MNRKIVIIDNFKELKLIEEKLPKLKNSSLILLSDNFTLSEINFLNKRKTYWFDENINSNNTKKLSEFIYNFLWTWYLDDKGNDLSKFEDLSLGVAFCPSIEILLTTVARYHLGLKKLLKKNDIIYYSSNTENIFIETISKLKQEIGFELNPVNVYEKREEITFGKLKQVLDPNGRVRDLKPIFSKPRLISRLLFKINNTLSLKNKRKNNILFLSAGKSEKYFEDILSDKRILLFNWVHQFSINYLFKSFGKNISFFQFYSNKKKFDLNYTLENLKANLSKKKILIDQNLIIKIFEKNLFIYFEDAINYYISARKFFQSNKIDLVILSADGYENFLIVAQAAKNINISTALIPHGYYDWGYKELKQKRLNTCLFDYIFCFGRFDYENALLSGALKKDIIITSYPYFEKFLPLSFSKSEKYSKALILIPDIMNISMLERIEHKMKYLTNVIAILNDLNISIKGIKTRNIVEVTKITKDNKKIFNYKDQKIPIISGYDNFDEITKDVDLIIGPQSTALIEAGLKGIHYFVYEHSNFSKFTPSIVSNVYKYLNISNDFKKLKRTSKQQEVSTVYVYVFFGCCCYYYYLLLLLLLPLLLLLFCS